MSVTTSMLDMGQQESDDVDMMDLMDFETGRNQEYDKRRPKMVENMHELQKMQPLQNLWRWM